MQRRATPIMLALLTALSVACAPPSAEPTGSIDLSVVDDAGRWVGVSEDEAGNRFALSTGRGIFRLTEDGPELLASNADLLALADVPPSSTFHDLAALGDGTFALVADNDGFLYDDTTGRLSRHFCYEPGFLEPDPNAFGPDPVPTDPAARQVTLSLGFDRENERIVAQPRTYHDETGELLASHVATFGRFDGFEQQWFDAGDLDLLAGGLAVEGTDSVLLADGTELYRYTPSTRERSFVADLAEHVGSIDGLALGAAGGLLVLDEENDRLVEVELVE